MQAPFQRTAAFLVFFGVIEDNRDVKDFYIRYTKKFVSSQSLSL